MSRYVVIYHPGDPVPDRMKYVDDSTTAPDEDDDAATLGVTVGSLWIDTTAPAVYACVDATTAAAVWVELTGEGGPSSGHYEVLMTGASPPEPLETDDGLDWIYSEVD